MMYQCDSCGKSIGLMANKHGEPILYKCPYSNDVGGPQQPIKRATTPKPREPRLVRIQILRYEESD